MLISSGLVQRTERLPSIKKYYLFAHNIDLQFVDSFSIEQKIGNHGTVSSVLVEISKIPGLP